MVVAQDVGTVRTVDRGENCGEPLEQCLSEQTCLMLDLGMPNFKLSRAIPTEQETAHTWVSMASWVISVFTISCTIPLGASGSALV